jgi:hypothetical protein
MWEIRQKGGADVEQGESRERQRPFEERVAAFLFLRKASRKLSLTVGDRR